MTFGNTIHSAVAPLFADVASEDLPLFGQSADGDWG